MSKTKTIIIVGDWFYDIYEHSFGKALQQLGYEITPIKISNFFNFNSKLGRIMHTIPFSLSTIKINREIKRAALKINPYAIIFWKCIHVYPCTYKLLSKKRIKTISYNNDDPFRQRFGTKYHWYDFFHWYWYKKSLKVVQYNFFYRSVNKHEATIFYGAKHAKVLLPYFIPSKNKPVRLTGSEKNNFDCDVVFIGHFENDNRVEYLKALVQAGLNVKLYGSEKQWTRDVLDDLYDYFSPIKLLEMEDYNKALNGAKICLAFLSKLNRDKYTRRCFEIPASGSLMLAERTDELQMIYKEDEEACFFSNVNELVSKSKWLIENPKLIEKISKKGYERVKNDNHDVISRAKQLIYEVN